MVQTNRWRYALHFRDFFAVNNNSGRFRDYVHPDDHNQPTFKMTPGFKSFTITELLTLKYEETSPLVIH